MEEDIQGQLVNVEQWCAIYEKDESFDGVFYYADSNTRFFCRPSCPSNVPKFNHVCIFDTAEAAVEAGFRPCRMCRPEGKEVTDVEWAGQVEAYIHEHYGEALSVSRIAAECHGNPSDLQQVFIHANGVSVMDYLERVRLDQARKLLVESACFIKEISLQIGFPNAAAFSLQFKKKEGIPPSTYRKIMRKKRRERARQLAADIPARSRAAYR